MNKRTKFAKSLLCVFARLISTGALVTGCRDVATIRTAESNSPDGKWIASVQTDQYGGAGTAGLQSDVTFRRAVGDKAKTEVLLLSQQTPSVNLRLTWLTSSHLEITYDRPVEIDFQAIRFGGVEITVRDLSEKSPSGPP
jgi:hypothetical protein